jgi:hypothetical protein
MINKARGDLKHSVMLPYVPVNIVQGMCGVVINMVNIVNQIGMTVYPRICPMKRIYVLSTLLVGDLCLDEMSIPWNVAYLGGRRCK